MALQSQAPRAQVWQSGPSLPRGGGFGRPSTLVRNAGAAVAVAALVGLAAFAWMKFGGSGPASAAAADAPIVTQGNTTHAPATGNTTPATPAAPTASSQNGQGTTGNASGGTGNTTGGSATGATTGAGSTTPAPIANSSTSSSTGGLPSDIRSLIDSAVAANSAGRLVEARTLFNRALFDARTPANERNGIRQQMQAINETLVFGPTVADGDPFCDYYSVKSGDRLITIVRGQSLPIDWRLLQTLNKMPNAGALHTGQRLKVVRVPFHAVVHKEDYRLDLYIGPPATAGSADSHSGPDGQDAGWTYVRSFKVGLGESNGTPEGAFVVKTGSKMVEPRWVNPRTGEVFESKDPRNPIGTRWIGLEGVDDNTRRFTGYGIHGTIDQDSIGKQMSMGCIRMHTEDIELVYQLLCDKVSTVNIVK